MNKSTFKQVTPPQRQVTPTATKPTTPTRTKTVTVEVQTPPTPAKRAAVPLRQQATPTPIKSATPAKATNGRGTGKAITKVTEPEDDAQALMVIPPGPIGKVTGDVQPTDITFPTLKLAKFVGPLVEDMGFAPGQFVLDGQEVLYDPKDQPDGVKVTVIKAHKTFVEYKKYGSEELPRVFQTLESAYEAGFTDKWDDDVPPTVTPSLSVLVLVELTEDVNYSKMVTTIGDRRFVPAYMTLRGKDYNTAGKTIIDSQFGWLKDGLETGYWTAVAQKRKLQSGNSTYVPILKQGQLHDQSILDFIRQAASATDEAIKTESTEE